MSEMVERVARAYEPELWARIDADLKVGRHQQPATFARDKSLRQARAAIAAMREPTEAMVKAAYTACRGDFDPEPPDEVYREMIDAAL